MNRRSLRRLRRYKIMRRIVDASRSFWKRFLKAAPIFLIAIALTFILSQVGTLQKLETIALDTQMRLQPTLTDTNVAIVRITDEDYRTLFHDRSPLNPKALQELIGAIALGKPKIIGVDVDTSAPEFLAIETPKDSPQIIWGRNAAFSYKDEKFYLFDVLGGKQPTPLSGLMTLKEDADGAVRRYQRTFPTRQGQYPSLSWAVVKQITGDRIHNLPENDQEMFISFAGNPKNSSRVNLPASQVLSVAGEQGWQNDSPIKDKIVLLGGDYAVQDEHNTPLGWMLGVEVLAEVIETELRGGGTQPANRSSIVLLQLIDGVVLLLLFQLYELKKAVLLSAFCIPILALMCSLIAFWSLANWAYFMPILMAVVFQQIHDSLKEYRKKITVEAFHTLKGSEKDEPST